MKKPLLSVCIATYNRAEYIGKTLESIIPQLTDEVEIVIADGASTDNTSRVVKHYAEACKQINYIQLPSKGGVDQDYCKAVELANGEYCWLFTDDDLIQPMAISTALNEILNINLSENDIEYRFGVIYIKNNPATSGTLKNEIFLNKDKIIQLLSQKIKKSGVKDIRF